jgi:Flp pilus assembly pilin Flp
MFASYWRNVRTTAPNPAQRQPRRLAMLMLLARLRTLAEREDGQTMAEYAIVLTVITVAVVSALLVLGSSIDDALNSVAVLV